MKKYLFLIMLFLLNCHFVYANSYGNITKQIISKGETFISAKKKKIRVEIKITTHEIPIKRDDNTIENNCLSCTYSRFPCSVVDCISIKVDNEIIFVPHSVYCDLADLNTATIKLENNKSILILDGGDASESYIVKIEFNKEQVTYRSLESGEFPSKPLQETKYNMQSY